MQTLVQLKMRKTELKRQIHSTNEIGEFASSNLMDEYLTVSEQLNNAEQQLLKPLSRCERCRWYTERD